MKTTDVLALLEANQDERGIQKWNDLGPGSGKLESFGIGLTRLRKLAKQIGRDHDLARQLWSSDVYDAKIISMLVDDPTRITRGQVEKQVDQLEQGHLAHVFASCDATLAKAPFAVELASEWMDSASTVRRRCGFMLLYEVSKSKKKSAPDEAFFLERIEHIRTSFQREERSVLGAMGGALLGMGKRSAKLNAAALKVARTIGPIEFDSNNDCEPFDVVKHLTSDYITKKLGL